MPPKFKSGQSGTRGQNTEFKRVNRIVKDKVIWVPPYLSKPKEGDDQVRTELRLFPPVVDGEVWGVLNPDTTEEMPLRSRLSDIFLDIEMVQRAGGLGGKGIETDMITSVLKTDEGTEAPKSFYTPYREFVWRLRTKIEEQFTRAKAGLPQDIPRHWFKYRDQGGFKPGVKFGRMPYPQGRGNTDKDTGEKRPDLYMVQCLALHINGTSRKDDKGKVRWQGPCIFVIPASAAADFFDRLTSRKNEDEPLGPKNNDFGDCISLKDGCTIKLKKLQDNKYVLRTGREIKVSKEMVERVYRPWDELINIPTVEDSIKWIAEAYGDPAMVDYAFREVDDNPKCGRWYEWVPEEWKGLADNIAEPLSKEALQELIKTNQGSGKTKAKAPVDDDDDDLDMGDNVGEDLDDIPFDSDGEGDAPEDVDFSDAPDGVDPDRYKNSLKEMRTQLAEAGDDEDQGDFE